MLLEAEDASGKLADATLARIEMIWFVKSTILADSDAAGGKDAACSVARTTSAAAA